MSEATEIRPAEIDWMTRAIGKGARLRASTKLPGSTSSDLFRCTVETAASTFDVVLRRYASVDDADPNVEAWALTKAAAADVGAPGLLAVNQGAADILPSMVLMTAVPGRVDLRPADVDGWLRSMASAMWRIHQLPADDAPNDFFTYYNGRTPPPSLEWSIPTPPRSSAPLPRREGKEIRIMREDWERAIELANRPAPEQPMHFIHRDFHPCNVLFDGDRLTGVVDWPSSCRGMAGVDIAHCRWNLALMYGVDMADRLVDAYREFAGVDWDYDPHFDLVELVEKTWTAPSVYPGWPIFGLTGLTDALMIERTEALLARALSRT